MFGRMKRVGAALGAAALLAGGAVAVAAPAQAAPRGIQINMSDVCATQKNGNALGLQAILEDWRRVDGWKCTQQGNTAWYVPRSNADVNGYCSRTYRTYAYRVQENAFGWRCA